MARRALLIGCGNIGAGYDLDQTGDVRTHARAYRRLGIPFDVVDPDREAAQRVAQRYGVPWFAAVDDVDPQHYEIVSIASSTPTHAAYLARFLAAETPLIFCEKPVATAAADIQALLERRRRSRSVVIVNYMRRFQPAYRRLRDRLRAWKTAAPLRDAVVRYQRGLLNNGGHALDLLEYLLERPIELGTLQVTERTAGPSADDPTITGRFQLDGAVVTVSGQPAPPPGIFDIELTFADRRIALLDRGDRIDVAHADASGALAIDPASSENRCLEDYMLPVFQAGLARIDGSDAGPDNFESACRLNLEILAALQRDASRGAG
jgi:predicted dehydrogenase